MFFQWYVFVLIGFFAMVSHSFNWTRTEIVFGKKEKRYSIMAVIVIAVPLIYWAATRETMAFGDTGAYKSMYSAFPSSLLEVPGFINEDSKDIGFLVLAVFIKSIIGNNVVIFFGIIAMICIICTLSTYRKYSCNFWVSVFLFIASADYIQWAYNGIRQFIPVAVLFAFSGLIVKKRYALLIGIIILLSTIHGSALIMIPIIFIVQGRSWNKKTLLLMFAMIVALLFLDRFTDLITTIMKNTQYSGEVNQFLNTKGTNYLRVLVFAIPPILSVLYKKQIDTKNDPMINICVNMSTISLGLYIISAFTSGIFIGRLPIYCSLYNYILLPWIVENVFEKRSSRMIYMIMAVLYLVFYYYQVTVTWKL